MKRTSRFCAALLLVGVLVGPVDAAAGRAPAGSAAAQRLAAKYAPIALLREEQDPPCDTAAEQYQPTSVDTVLGNLNVNLVRFVPGRGIQEVKRAPTAADIAGLGDDYYLDISGEPLGDTCVYARDFAKLVDMGRAPAIAYARIAREPGRSGFALQYWFFWYFNQFNDLHEGDWEGMQLTFDADTPAAALREDPSQVIVFQHAGGERADWHDAKVGKEGSRPIVYPAAGSHATFYGSAVYVENGQGGSGVGCDVTTGPLREVSLRPVLLPARVSERGPFRWLSYDGHWGEKQKGFNNGPTGPTTKAQWTEPLSWMERQRSTSPRLPGGSLAGPQVTKAFCGAVASVSKFLNLNDTARRITLAILALLAVALLVAAVRTRWGPVDLERLRGKRAFGQLIATAGRVYGRHWLILVPIGLTALPIVGLTRLLGGFIAENQTPNPDDSGINIAFGDTLNGFARPVASALVAAIIILVVRELADSRTIGVRESFARLRPRFWRVVGAQLLATLGVILLAISVIGLPWAAYKFVAWQFVQQEVLFTDKSIRESFHGSSDLVRGRWWRTLRVIGFLWLISIVLGPVLGFVLIFTNFSLLAINLLGSLVFALIIPFVTVGRTLLYFDLQARAEESPAKPRRSWRPWRASRQRRGAVEPAPSA